MVLDADGKQVLFCGLWYDDEFVRTAEGWRMTRRVETKCFDKLVTVPRADAAWRCWRTESPSRSIRDWIFI